MTIPIEISVVVNEHLPPGMAYRVDARGCMAVFGNGAVIIVPSEKVAEVTRKALAEMGKPSRPSESLAAVIARKSKTMRTCLG